MSMEVLEALALTAEIERKIDNLVRSGPLTERKKIDGRWHITAIVGRIVDGRTGSSREVPLPQVINPTAANRCW
jgi:hypothetical protein